MFLLDTNVVSELRKTRTGTADRRVVEWVDRVPIALQFLSVISLQELEVGVLHAERVDPAKGDVLRRWLDGDVVQTFSERTVPVDADVARAAAALHVPGPAPFRDALIGATALVHNLVMVTRNTHDFARFAGLDVVNPWK